MTFDELAHNTAEHLEEIAANPEIRTRARRLELYERWIRHALSVAYRLGKGDSNGN
jgi:hypothetical protein